MVIGVCHMSMKNKYQGFLLATTGGVAAMAGGAQAADMPVKAHAVASWEGWYVGLHAGIASNQSKFDPGYGSYSNAQQSATGFIGGGQIGYNWQSGMWVYGLEADISGLTGTAKQGASDPTKGNALEARIQWLSTFRARAGWLINPSTMLYGTGGLAVGGVRNDFNFNGLASTTAPANTIKSAHKTKAGWTLGAGIETIVNTKWTLGLEALYVDLGSTSGTSASGKTTTFKNSAIIGRLKLNYKF
jgi:outer membrane immunogenic protein